jgi:hypothetical protein
MKEQGAGLELSTFEAEVRRAIDCAAKACSRGRVDFRAYKPRVVTIVLNKTSVDSVKINLDMNSLIKTDAIFCII